MSDGVAPESGTILVGETRTISISFEGMLDEPNEEKLTGTPTFAQYKKNATTGEWDVSTDLTVNNAAVSTDTVRVGSNDVRTGAVVLALATGAVAATRYRLVCTCGTNSSPAQTLRGILHLDGVGVV